MKTLLIVGFLGLSGTFAGCAGMQMARAAPCPHCTEKVTTVYNSKGFAYRSRIDYSCSVCGTACNLNCPRKCTECANSLACCTR